MNDLPDELTNLSEEEREERKQRLQEEAAETAQRLEGEQQEFLDSLEEEHGGDLVETQVTLPGDNPATIECVINGELMNRMSHVDGMLEDFQDPEPGDFQNVEQSMDEVASILADITKESKYSKAVFYAIYERFGPQALGKHTEAIFDAIEKEVRRMTGDVDGFRSKPQGS